MNVYLYPYNSNLLLDDDTNHGDQVCRQVETNDTTMMDTSNNHSERNTTTMNATDNVSIVTKEYHSDDTPSTIRPKDASQPNEPTYSVTDTATSTQVKTATASLKPPPEDPSLNGLASAGTMMSTGEPISSTYQSPTSLGEEEKGHQQQGKGDKATRPSSLKTATSNAPLLQQGRQFLETESTPPLHRPSPPLDHEYLVKSIDWLDPKTNTSRVVRIITQNGK